MANDTDRDPPELPEGVKPWELPGGPDPWELPEGIEPGNYTNGDLYEAVDRFMDEFGIRIPLGFEIDYRATPVILAALEEDDPTIFSN